MSFAIADRSQGDYSHEERVKKIPMLNQHKAQSAEKNEAKEPG
jgi:hypothetical protein